MFFVALATDYDGTLAEGGRVAPEVIDTLKAVRRSGRKLILVTGRELPDLKSVFLDLELFDAVVVENGALLYDPATREETLLTEGPPPAFVARLKELGVSPLGIGRSIVATREPHETEVLRVIRDMGLELHIIFNKGAVMVLPGDVNKAWGLKHALHRLGLSPHNVVGIGDAENDQVFLSACGCGAAVANALPSVKEKADLVVAAYGGGVIELASQLIGSDLRDLPHRMSNALPALGTRSDGSVVHLDPFATTLVAGTSGGGKSTMVTALLEQMRSLDFQFCVVDPEGDYAELPDAVVIGSAKQEPTPEAVLDLLTRPDVSVVVNLLAIDPADRPAWLAGFLPVISKLRAETGRPHWLVLDEVHHCLPADWNAASIVLPKEMPATLAVTVHPDQVARGFLDLVTTMVAVGDRARAVIDTLCSLQGRGLPTGAEGPIRRGEALALGRSGHVDLVTASKPKERQRRHVRKYAQGELGEDKSFYFRGPRGQLNLRAQNLQMFLQIAAGVDDRTWQHHLRLGDYSRWFREAIKDEALAAEAAEVERDRSTSAEGSRQRIKALVEQRYTAPAKKR